MNEEKPQNRSAVALTYNQQQAPYLSAKGQGLVAEEIIRVAAEHGILIHEDPALVDTLSMLQLGQEIPESLYKAIAEVIAFAYSLREDKPDLGSLSDTLANSGQDSNDSNR
ncbi:flagellar biosynthesis protein FlhB [Motiliproteus coralliicola]|uniref:Flagellar biosynthetic protein FlhB n=1 Tax=Motiliproteus coralliicola TaxID=2283196 RepID=A0A369WMZ3_9GAMM|nr:EscU/YscU/HrcU family type III secretion system export apparatus switch protein [Motiliproteus coralliicola]RDE22439.1 flagellar biosynthesis protein FlhB [Motiliproteus coralliicola]